MIYEHPDIFFQFVTLFRNMNPREPRQQLQSRQTGVQVCLPGRYQTVTDQVGGPDKQGVGRVWK